VQWYALQAMAVTMMDIARDVKVSVVTVSKVLRNQGRISAATRKRVLRRARELHYQMNWVARSLVTRRTFTIGLLLPDFTHPFFAEIARAVAQAVRPHGYHVIISYSEEDPKLELSEADSLLARQVDGLIVASAQRGRCLDLFQRIQRRKVPYVLIDRPIAGLQASFVGVDNRAIGRLATEQLIAQGCCRIAHLRGPEIGIAEERLEGYRRALAKRELQCTRAMWCRAATETRRGMRVCGDCCECIPPRTAFSVTTTQWRSAPSRRSWRLALRCPMIFPWLEPVMSNTLTF